MPAKKPELGCRDQDLHPSRMPTEPSESESELTGERQPGGGGGPTNTSTMEKKNSRPGVQAAEFKMKVLLMVEVPRTHSAKLLLLNLVMVGVPTNTFAMDENKPETADGGGPTNTFSKVSV